MNWAIRRAINCTVEWMIPSAFLSFYVSLFTVSPQRLHHFRLYCPFSHLLLSLCLCGRFASRLLAAFHVSISTRQKQKLSNHYFGCVRSVWPCRRKIITHLLHRRRTLLHISSFRYFGGFIHSLWAAYPMAPMYGDDIAPHIARWIPMVARMAVWLCGEHAHMFVVDLTHSFNIIKLYRNYFISCGPMPASPAYHFAVVSKQNVIKLFICFGENEFMPAMAMAVAHGVCATWYSCAIVGSRRMFNIVKLLITRTKSQLIDAFVARSHPRLFVSLSISGGVGCWFFLSIVSTFAVNETQSQVKQPNNIWQ